MQPSQIPRPFDKLKASTDIASNSDKPTSHYALEENGAYYVPR
jgi:hypothetical protein